VAGTQGCVACSRREAGTGKLTGALLDRGLTVDAVEPDPEMLGVLHRLYPAAAAHQGPAEALPLADASFDAVLVADAWHWLPRSRPSSKSVGCSALVAGSGWSGTW
jgi:hypothetical protein